MLMSDRRHALQQRNASAAITALSRIADLLLGRLAEEEATKPQLTHVIVHQVICPVCKERSAASPTPLPKDEPEAAKPRRASGWDDYPEPEPTSTPEPPPGPTIQVPKLPRTGRRRDSPLVSGLV